MNVRPSFSLCCLWLFELRRAIVRALILLAAIITLAVAGSTILLFVDESSRARWVSEGQIIEVLSAWTFVVVAFLLVVAGGVRRLFQNRLSDKRQISHPWLLASLTACFAAREMDFHSRFTGGSVIKTSYYLSADHGWQAKALPLFALTMVAALCFQLAVRYGGVLLARLREGEMLGVLPIAAFLLVLISKGLDSAMGTLARNGWMVADRVKKLAGGIEEISELFIPCLFLWMFGMAVWKGLSVRAIQIHRGEAESETRNSQSDDLPMAA